MITINAPTGNIGRRLVELLVSAGKPLTLVTRRPDRVDPSLRTWEIVRQAQSDDASALTRATEGTDVLFWLTPPNVSAPDVRGWYRKVADAVSRAVRANRITRVVHLSSAGAHWPDGLGPISGLHDVEAALNDAAPNVTHLRPGFFMENFLAQLATIRREGKLYWLYPGHFRPPMIAARDIADAAAGRLIDFTWSGRQVLGLHGPVDLSLEQATEVLGLAVARQLRHVQILPHDFRKLAQGWGASADHVESFIQMVETMGRIDWRYALEPRTTQSTTSTTLGAWARQTLAPRVLAG